jgi:hypothetical protein
MPFSGKKKKKRRDSRGKARAEAEGAIYTGTGDISQFLISRAF